MRKLIFVLFVLFTGIISPVNNAFAQISVTANVGAISGSGAAVTSPTVATTGCSMIVVVVTDYQAVSVGSVSDSRGNTYALVRNANDGAVARVLIFVYYGTNGGGSQTVTYTGGGTCYPSINVIVVSGSVASSSALDQQNGVGSSAVTSLSPGSVTPSEDNEIIITGVNFWTGTSPSVNSGFTITNTQAYSVGVSFGGGAAYKIQTTAAAVNPTWSWSTGSSSAALQATFKKASASTGGGGFYLLNTD